MIPRTLEDVPEAIGRVLADAWASGYIVDGLDDATLSAPGGVPLRVLDIPDPDKGVCGETVTETTIITELAIVIRAALAMGVTFKGIDPARVCARWDDYTDPDDPHADDLPPCCTDGPPREPALPSGATAGPREGAAGAAADGRGGFTGELCTQCGSPNVRRTGACGTCENCGSTTSCG